MQYLKYRWNEDRGDEHAEWGGSWWYFEIGSDGYPVRQIEEYDSGVRLRYGPDHEEDKFGGLGTAQVSECDQLANQELSATEFEELWAAGPWHNQSTRA